MEPGEPRGLGSEISSAGGLEYTYNSFGHSHLVLPYMLFILNKIINSLSFTEDIHYLHSEACVKWGGGAGPRIGSGKGAKGKCLWSPSVSLSHKQHTIRLGVS